MQARPPVSVAPAPPPGRRPIPRLRLLAILGGVFVLCCGGLLLFGAFYSQTPQYQAGQTATAGAALTVAARPTATPLPSSTPVPSATLAPSATAKPSNTPRPPSATPLAPTATTGPPTETAAPPTRTPGPLVVCGVYCKDGSISRNTGSGACSGHQGIRDKADGSKDLYYCRR